MKPTLALLTVLLPAPLTELHAAAVNGPRNDAELDAIAEAS